VKNINVMIKYLILLCAFISLTANAQKVSESEAFKKAQKFLNDKKLKVPSVRTRGEEVSKPFYVFNAEDGKGSIIISGDERLPEVLAYSKSKSIDENNLPEGLEELLPILKVKGSTRGEAYCETPAEYVPRNTTPIPCLTDYVWEQHYPFNQYCPIVKNEGEASDIHAPAGCVPIAVSTVMAFFKYPNSVDAFNTTYKVKDEYVDVAVPYTEFKWDLIRNENYNSNWSDEECKAVGELCYHVGCAFKALYNSGSTSVSANQTINNWENVMKDIYKYEVVEYMGGGEIIPDEEYWKFLDSYLESGVPVVAWGGSHSFVIDGRDDKGMYCLHEQDVNIILQPSLWKQIGAQGRLDGANNRLHLFAFVPPKEHTYRYVPKPKDTSAINSVEVNRIKDGAVYNLQGRKVGNTLEGLPKGVYIKDGKKYLVK
jgi:hypothetical protein